MSFRVKEIVITGAASGVDNPAEIHIVCDTLADLPSGVNFVSGYAAQIGSTAHIVSDSTDYEMQSSGAWVQQTPAGLANVYTKTQTDAMLAELSAALYVHDSIQVNLNDLSWTQSAGGMYYSQTIQLSHIALLYSVCLSGFSSLRPTDYIQAACRRSGAWSGFTLYSNTNTFNTGAWVTVSGIGTKA